MKTLYFVIFIAAMTGTLHAQIRFAVPDTLLQEHFDGTMDPADNMLLFPTGFDTSWVNLDDDGLPCFCVAGPEAPSGWYLEGDFSTPVPVAEGNSCFTSCSFTKDELPNNNWLITKRIYIPDSSYALSWRSMPFSGPGYMDGYMVLVSRGSNQPFEGGFQDTLFRAAETVDILVTDYSTKLNEYTFSPGYMHANSFTDTAYYFKEQFLTQNGQLATVYRCRLEPHSVNLKSFAGDSVYIAFLHHSTDDYLMQVDDILVASDQSSRVLDPSDLVHSFSISPNPVDQETYISWQVNGNPTEVLLRISSVDGREVFSRRFAAEGVPRYFADLGALSAGTYICSLQFPQGVVSKVLIKQ
ncbi:MAG: T9SS type A sorting domain-containing protein [Chitinophagales bacterium]|nr:T9SS type A sorting domain-containing protein [Chitinophagales bacterium]